MSPLPPPMPPSTLETPHGFRHRSSSGAKEREKFSSHLVAVQSGVALNCEAFSDEVCSRSPVIHRSRQSLGDADLLVPTDQFVLAIDDGQVVPQAQEDPEDVFF